MRMSRPVPGAYVIAGRAFALAALAIADAASLYTGHNAVGCGGGLGWIGPGLGVYAIGLFAALTTLAALASALALAVVRRSWAVGACLAVGAALGVVVAVGSSSTLARDLVGIALGTGCSWFYSAVAMTFALLLVAAFAGDVLALGWRRRAA